MLKAPEEKALVDGVRSCVSKVSESGEVFVDFELDMGSQSPVSRHRRQTVASTYDQL